MQVRILLAPVSHICPAVSAYLVEAANSLTWILRDKRYSAGNIDFLLSIGDLFFFQRFRDRTCLATFENLIKSAAECRVAM